MDEHLLPQTPTMSPGVNLKIDGEIVPNLFLLQQKIQEKSRRDPNINSKKRRYFGKAFGFCFFRNEPLLTLGPDWILFSITWTIFLVLGLLIALIFLQSPVLKAITLVVTLCESLIYLYTGLKNPGINTAIDPDNETLQNFREYPEYCVPCGLLKDRSTTHCLECNVCVKGFDHHCPWTGKCIGAGNIQGFQVFICGTFLYFIYLFGIVFYALISFHA